MKSRYLSAAEITAIFSRLTADRRLLFDVALSSGLRIGDTVRLRRRNIKRIGGGEVQISYTAEKTGKRGQCTVYGTVAEELCRLSKSFNGFLWPSYGKSGHITRQTAWKWFKDAAKEANVDINGVSPHSLRKSYAVAVRREKGFYAAHEALQHKYSETTAIYAYSDIYSGADPQAPILWCQLTQLVDLIAERLDERKKELN